MALILKSHQNGCCLLGSLGESGACPAVREVAVGVRVSPLALLRHQYFVLVVITQFQETTESFLYIHR